MHTLAPLAGLMVVPGLFALALLMSWLEQHFTRQMVAHDVARAWEAELTPEQLEEAVHRSVARILPDRSRASGRPAG
jgi:hypothetical protein